MLYLVTDTDIPAQLHLQKLQLRVRKNSMLAACRHIYHITSLDILHITINNGMSIAGKHRPYLIPVLMAVIIHAVPPVQSHNHRQAAFLDAEHPVVSPAFICKHHLLAKIIHIRLDMGTFFLVTDQDSLR